MSMAMSHLDIRFVMSRNLPRKGPWVACLLSSDQATYPSCKNRTPYGDSGFGSALTVIPGGVRLCGDSGFGSALTVIPGGVRLCGSSGFGSARRT
ncbi:hypothetical protein GCM10009560_52020 [Nonomuraea longicatena]|uniref:Uncharacterized protein n=1 Tax=Nonomuraea longicatena TaxID=83682 RepID=A0ABP4ASC2_9ACTN